MATLQLSFLGPPHIVADGAAVEIPVRKALALLAYLAVTERRHGREALSALLWPDSDAAHARGSLRYTLSALREAIGAEWLDAEADAIQLHAQGGAGIWLDVAAFRAEAAQARVFTATAPTCPVRPASPTSPTPPNCGAASFSPACTFRTQPVLRSGDSSRLKRCAARREMCWSA